MPRHIDPAQQHALFRRAVEALGGQAAFAGALNLSVRHAGRLYSGASPLHDGILEDLGRALIAHADLCRRLERELSPAFAGNLTAEQERGTTQRGRHWRGKSRETVMVKDPASRCEACGRNAIAGHAEGCPNTREPWPLIRAELAGGQE